jgi:tetratricopeptide (TPR) repeat protein
MIKRILTSLAALFLITAVTLPALALETPEERRAHKKIEAQKFPTQADDAMRANEYDKAIDLYTKAITSHAFDDQPQFLGNMYFARGRAYQQKSDCASALNDFNEAIKTIEKGDLFYSMAACHLQLSQDDAALNDLDHAVKADPDAAMYRNARCKLLFNRKDFAGAMPDCERAVAAQPTDKDLLVAASQAAEQVGNRPRAAELYRQLLKVDPGNPVATEGLKRTGG